MPIEIAIIETREPPVHQRIAAKDAHLRELGMTYSEIGKRLGVDRWTVGKAVRWMKRSSNAGLAYNNSSID